MSKLIYSLSHGDLSMVQTCLPVIMLVANEDMNTANNQSVVEVKRLHHCESPLLEYKQSSALRHNAVQATVLSAVH